MDNSHNDTNIIDAAVNCEKQLKLQLYVAEKCKNNIKQGDDNWHKEKVFTIGGSSIATVMGIGGFGDNISKILTDKLGITKFKETIAPWWGTLFERVIELYVEKKYKCSIVGENLYIPGPPGTAYSPDGMTILDINGKLTTVLLEFKAPYSRIPDGKIPKYYVPQVKMGLQIIDICEIGLFIECVFRRCSFSQLGFDFTFDTTLVPKYTGDKVLCYGIIGFYTYSKALQGDISKQYDGNPTDCMESNLNDFGMASPELFTTILEEYKNKNIFAVYSNVVANVDESSPGTELENIVRQVSDMDATLLGLLPWKLLHADFHYVEKSPNYIDPYLPIIRDLIDTVKFCLAPENETKKYNEIQSFMERH